jgi:hypothetical protein
MSQQQVTTPTPNTDEEFAIQALTIHGAFFERKCQDTILQANDWTLRETNYPVEHRGKASNLDIWAEKAAAGARLSFPIECKKNNPEFVDWVFFPRPDHSTSDLYVRGIDIDAPLGYPANWTISPLRQRIKYDLVVADEARETKGNYQLIKDRKDRTKTMNTAITEAATQIAIATQSILRQEYEIVQKLSETALERHLSQTLSKMTVNSAAPYAGFFCFPTIVTTANLYTCEFQNEDIDLTTGEISWNKAKLNKCPYLLFNYALPVALQPSLDVTDDITYESYWEAAHIAARMPIFVVQSKALPTFLERIMLPQHVYNAPTKESWRTLDLHPETVTI